MPRWQVFLVAPGAAILVFIFFFNSLLVDLLYKAPPMPPSLQTVQADMTKELKSSLPQGSFAGDAPGGLGATPPPPPPPARPVLMRVGAAYMESKLLRKVEWAYPMIDTQKRLDINLHLEVTVDEQGNVQAVRIIRGHPFLDETAVEAVKKWRFTPTYLNGIPIKVIFDLVLPYRQPLPR
jgi:TonB family protein